MNDSNISRPSKGNERAPIPMHKRLALGEKVDGQRNPFGAEKGSTECKVANGGRKTY